MDDALRAAIERTGGVVKFARAVGRSHSTVLGWGRVPAEMVVEIERQVGIPRHELRPDLHLAPDQIRAMAEPAASPPAEAA